MKNDLSLNMNDFYERNGKSVSILKGQMHHHDGIGSKWAYTCHLSNKTTHKTVLCAPQLWLMKVSKNQA